MHTCSHGKGWLEMVLIYTVSEGEKRGRRIFMHFNISCCVTSIAATDQYYDTKPGSPGPWQSRA